MKLFSNWALISNKPSLLDTSNWDTKSPSVPWNEDENKIYQVLEVESMEKMQEAFKDPELAKLRTDAGVNLDSQELVFLEE